MSEFSFVDNIPFSIAAGESLSLPAGSWDYLYMAELSGGDLLAEGSALRLPFILGRQIRVRKKETGTILLTNRGSTTAEGVIYAGSGDVEDRAMVGAVEVTNLPGSPQWSDDGNSFFMFVYGGAVSAEYSHVQMFNPIANTKKLIVSNISASHSAGVKTNMIFAKYSTALSTVDPSYGEVNKKFGNATVSGAEARIQTQAGIITGDILWVGGVADNTLIELLMDEPVILSPGEGFMVRTSLVNTTVRASFQYHSEDA